MRALLLRRSSYLGVLLSITLTISGCFEEEEGAAPTSKQSSNSGSTASAGDGSQPLWELTAPSSNLVHTEALVEFINAVREETATDPVESNAELTAAAQAHADFILQHRGTYEGQGIIYHDQVEGLEGFTGMTADERAKAAGYEGVCFNEVIAFKPTAVGAAQSWLETLYHRFALTDPRVTEIGYAEAGEGVTIINVLKVGTRTETEAIDPTLGVGREIGIE